MSSKESANSDAVRNKDFHAQTMDAAAIRVDNFDLNALMFDSLTRCRQLAKKLDDRTSHWVMKGPLGADIEWDAETTRLDENERVAWNSKDNSEFFAFDGYFLAMSYHRLGNSAIARSWFERSTSQFGSATGLG